MKKKCKVKGLPKSGYICIRVTVGGEYCTQKKYCEHQEPEKSNNEKKRNQ